MPQILLSNHLKLNYPEIAFNSLTYFSPLNKEFFINFFYIKFVIFF